MVTKAAEVIRLSQELREALDEPALKRWEKCNAAINEEMLNLCDKYSAPEVQEALDEYSPKFLREGGYKLTDYCDTGGGEAALRLLTYHLQLITVELMSQCSQSIEDKRRKAEAERLREEKNNKARESLGILKKELNEPFGILALSPSLVISLYPFAQERFNGWMKELHEEIPELEELTIEQIVEDLNNHLDDNKKNSAIKYEETVKGWLYECIDRGDELKSTNSVPSADMSSLKGLLKTVYGQKEEEARKEEYERKWCTAWKHLYPQKLEKKVQHYLTDAEEKKFAQALRKATTAYVNGDTNLTSFEASEAVLWREEIGKREEQENKCQEAQALATQYDHKLSSEIERFKAAGLYAEEQPPSVFLNQPPPIDNFSKLLTSEQHEEVRSIYINLESKKFKDLMTSHPDLTDYITMDEKAGHWRLWASFKIGYELDGVPSLRFYLRPFVVFESQVTLKRHQGYFLDQPFTFPLNAQEKTLGYFYGVISPDQFDADTEAGFWWQTIPISLIKVLKQGGSLPTIEIITADAAGTTYKVRGFKQPVHIPQEFSEWLKALPTLEALVFLDYMAQNVYDILSQHLQTTGSSAQLTVTHHASSKKEQMISLLDEGEPPNSSRVKALGLTYKVRQTYYSAWKRGHKS